MLLFERHDSIADVTIFLDGGGTLNGDCRLAILDKQFENCGATHPGNRRVRSHDDAAEGSGAERRHGDPKVGRNRHYFRL